LKAHVSPQQADPKASIKLGSKPVGGAGMGAGPNRGPAGSTPNSKAIPCRFGSQCSRPDCAFSHPWIINNALDRSGSDDALTGAGFAGGIPCKFGLQCSRRGFLLLTPPPHPALLPSFFFPSFFLLTDGRGAFFSGLLLSAPARGVQEHLALVREQQRVRV
jgi:hypothetical protein